MLALHAQVTDSRERALRSRPCALGLRLQRYASAMATIQIRNVPDAVHRIYQVRAAAAGMSLQEYLLGELVRNAELRSPAELVAEVADRMRAEGPDGYARGSSAELVRAEREAH
jgi:antitoxin FitA